MTILFRTRYKCTYLLTYLLTCSFLLSTVEHIQNTETERVLVGQNALRCTYFSVKFREFSRSLSFRVWATLQPPYPTLKGPSHSKTSALWYNQLYSFKFYLGLPVQRRLAGQAYIFTAVLSLFFDTGTYRWESAQRAPVDPILTMVSPAELTKYPQTFDKSCPLFYRGAKCPNFWPKFRPRSSSDRRICLLYTSPSPRDRTRSRMPSSA